MILLLTVKKHRIKKKNIHEHKNNIVRIENGYVFVILIRIVMEMFFFLPAAPWTS